MMDDYDWMLEVAAVAGWKRNVFWILSAG